MVTIYSTTTCPYCKMLKEFLQDHGIGYTEKLVDVDELAREEMAAASGGFLGVPFMVIDTEAGRQTVIGFDKAKISEFLHLN